MTGEALSFRVSGPFQTKAAPGSPVVEASRPGLGVAAVDVTRDGDALRFTLLLTYGFPDAYFLAFEDIRRAIVVAMQEPASGACAVFSVIDPSINDLEPIIENFRPPAGGESVAFMRGWCGVPVEVRVPAGAAGLLVRATLHGFASPLIHIGKDEVSS